MKTYTSKKPGRGKDSFPKNPHCIGRAGAEFAPHTGQFEYRGSEKVTVAKGAELPSGGKKGY